MPRPERAVDASSGPVQRLAADLRQLRESAGRPTYRELARRCGYSVSALADAAGGRRLPALTVLRGYVVACGANPADWEERWRAASLELAEIRADRSADVPPYVGLNSYQPADSALFFGRERLVGELAERLKRSGFLAVVGPSGTGKSSLLRAGLFPALVDNPEIALRAEDCPVLTPGSHPLATHAAALKTPAQSARLIVVDQFEELFTVCDDESERAQFIEALLDTAAAPDVRVAVGLRADFYGHCAAHFRLARALQDATVLVGPMDEEELRRAVTGPAALVGLSVERALVTKVIADAAGQAGALPMVSHALLQTWRHRQGDTLTLAAYEAAGGVTGAIARTAEAVYESLTDPQRRAARQILTRLTALGDGTADTRRRVDRSELAFGDVDTVIERLAHARLLVLDGAAVEIAHEALIGAWPRLGDWLTEDREALRVHRDLTDAAASWHALDRDPGALHRGARLAIAREWAAGEGRAGELNPMEAEFLAASVAAEADERAAASRRAQQLRALSSALAGLLALALVTSLVAVGQWRSAVRERQEATSRQLATQALAVAQTDASEAARLSLRAYDEAPTVEARGAMLSLAGRPAYTARLPQSSVLTAVAFSPDGSLLAAAENTGPVTVWDLASGTKRAQLTGNGGSVRSLAFTPSGRLVTGGEGGVLVWDVERGQAVSRLNGLRGVVDGVAVSPDGALVAAIGVERRILLWRSTGGAQVAELRGSGGKRSDVAFSPDGRLLASAGDDGTAMLWDIATRARVGSVRPGPQPLHAVAFSPDGDTLAVGGQGRDITIWDVATGRQLRVLRGHTASVRSLAFTRYGTLVSSANDRTPRLWDVDRGRLMSKRDGSTSEVYAIAVSPDGRLVAGAGKDRAVLLWDTATMPMTGHTDQVQDVAVAPGAATVASAANDGRVILWDPRSRTVLTTLSTGGAAATGVAYRPDGRLLASAHADGVRIWDVATGRLVRTPDGPKERVLCVAFAPDGKLLAVGSVGGVVRLFDAESGAQVAEVRHPTQVERVAFSSDGTAMVSASQNGTVVVWDVARRTTRAVLHDQPLLTVAVTRDASLVAIGRSDGTVALWTAGTQRPEVVLRGHTGPIESIAFSPDERLLATGSSDREIRLWSAPRHTLYAVLNGFAGKVSGLAFSGDGRVLYAGGSDHTVTPWPVDPDDARHQTCERLSRDVSRPPDPHWPNT